MSVTVAAAGTAAATSTTTTTSVTHLSHSDGGERAAAGRVLDRSELHRPQRSRPGLQRRPPSRHPVDRTRRRRPARGAPRLPTRLREVRAGDATGGPAARAALESMSRRRRPVPERTPGKVVGSTAIAGDRRRVVGRSRGGGSACRWLRCSRSRRNRKLAYFRPARWCTNSFLERSHFSASVDGAERRVTRLDDERHFSIASTALLVRAVQPAANLGPRATPL